MNSIKDKINTRCPLCYVKNSLCLSSSLKKNEITALGQVINRSKILDKNETLYQYNDTFDSLYIVHSGLYKSIRINENGEERVLAFHLPGEIMGLDGIHTDYHHTSVLALCMSSFNKIPYNQLLELSKTIPQVHKNLLKILSREIYSCKKNHIDINSKAKLALFVLNISHRFEVRGFSGEEFTLTISQRDIANHLGMAEETLSRNFKKLQKQGAIKFKKHILIIQDYDLLESISES